MMRAGAQYAHARNKRAWRIFENLGNSAEAVVKRQNRKRQTTRAV